MQATANQVILFRRDGRGTVSPWLARYEGPHAEGIVGLFGTATLPTPFGGATTSQHVLKVVSEGNPGANVVVA